MSRLTELNVLLNERCNHRCGGGCPMEAMDQDLQPMSPPLCMLYRSLGDLLEEEL